jgi:hypothetical protein
VDFWLCKRTAILFHDEMAVLEEERGKWRGEK